MRSVPFAARASVRVGLIGCGARGRSHLRELLQVDGAEIVALCDPQAANAERGRQHVRERNRPDPQLYTGADGTQQLCARDALDLVYIASPWDQHAAQAILAMEAGHHVAVEVPASITIDECWQLVDASERTRRHCVLLENCCYDYNELLVLEMVRAGVFGTLTYAEAAYIHDLRSLLFEQDGIGGWRRTGHIERDGNLYPTHGLGPVAQYLDIHRGDRFTQLVSMSSREAGLTEYRDAHMEPGDGRRRETYRCGDMNTSLLKTAQGRTVLLQHDVVTPRPYTRLNTIAGTRGMFTDFPPRVFLDDRAPRPHMMGSDPDAWLPLTDFKQYENPLWVQLGEHARQTGGHGGCDFVMNWRLIQCLREGLPPDIDVYDAAAWSAPGPLSEQSVASGSAPVTFPDFTRGNWE